MNDALSGNFGSKEKDSRKLCSTSEIDGLGKDKNRKGNLKDGSSDNGKIPAK